MRGPAIFRRVRLPTRAHDAASTLFTRLPISLPSDVLVAERTQEAGANSHSSGHFHFLGRVRRADRPDVAGVLHTKFFRTLLILPAIVLDMPLTLADRRGMRSDLCRRLADRYRMNADALRHAADRHPKDADRRTERSDPCQSLADRHPMEAGALRHASDRRPKEGDHAPVVADQPAAQLKLCDLRLLQVFYVQIVLIADELDQLFVRAEAPVHAHGPWTRVRFRVLDRDVDLHPAIGGTPEALRDLRAAGERCAVDVEPALVA